MTKSGSVFRPRSAKCNAAGEQGETEGVLRHLTERGDCEVVLFQKVANGVDPDEVSFTLGVTVVQPHLYDSKGEPFDELTLAADQKTAFDVDLAQFADREVVGVVDVAGYAPTMSMIDNPRFSTVQAAAIRYSAPKLALIESLRVPRISVNNDPRTYARDQEMSMGWPHAVPQALLDQTDRTVDTTIGGRRYRRVSVHARCESWGWLPSRQNTDEVPCVVVAHAHLADGIRGKQYDAWSDVLGDPAPEDLAVYGRGWERHPLCLHSSTFFGGELKPERVLEVFGTATCGPVVSHTPGFYTGKPYVMVSCGCLPLLHEKYDPKALFRPLGDWSRIHRPGDLRRLSEQLHRDVGLREQFREEWREACVPHWGLLDEVVDRLLAGTFAPDPERYGGYF